MHDSPVGVVESVLRGFSSENWIGVADLFDEGSLSEFRRNVLWRYSIPTPRLDVDQSTSDPVMRLREELPRISSIEELELLPPRQLYAVWLESHSPRAQVNRLVESGQVSRTRAEKVLPSIVSNWNYTVIGVVMDGDTVAHVLYRGDRSATGLKQVEADLLRASAPAAELETLRDIFGKENPGLVTCRRNSDGFWRLLASHYPFGIGVGVIWIGDDDVR